MTDNLKLWDALKKTDPSATKSFTRGGGFRGTAIKPIWIVQRLTEQFGPVGVGWGMGKPDFSSVIGTDGEVLVYCTVECWHTSRENTFVGVGGDKAIAKNKNGLFADDEAFKKAFTDAVGNAFKFVGVGADIHMGLFDDSKYVAAMHKEFSEDGGKREASKKLNGPFATSITGLEKGIREFASDMGKVATWEEWCALRDDKKYRGLIEQAERDHPDWWGGWPNQPDNFTPLRDRISQLEEGLAKDIASMTNAG